MRKIMLLLFVLLIFSGFSAAQTTEFTYQGKLNNNSAPANGNYDFEFRLYDVAGGQQLGATNQRLNVQVVNGIFTVRLDFGANFSGGNRELEISVRVSGDPNFTFLSPRQPITSAPYSIRSVSAGLADDA